MIFINHFLQFFRKIREINHINTAHPQEINSEVRTKNSLYAVVYFVMNLAPCQICQRFYLLKHTKP